MGAGKPSKTLKDAPTVIIIGGGYAGVKLAAALDKQCNVVLIDRKDYFLHNIGTPRGMVDTEFMKKCMIPYTELLKNGHVVKGQVEKITDTEVHLHGQDSPITGFDYLVIATGTSYCFPYKVPMSEKEAVIPLYEEVLSKITTSSNIVCVGAGSTGLEAATEISCKFPDKKVTIVHSRDKLFEDFKKKFGETFEQHLKEGFPNVTLILGDRLVPVSADGGEEAAGRKYVEPAGGKVMTQKGVEIPCDLLFWCVGGRLNCASFKEHFESAMEKNGQLKVDEFLQVEGHPNIFAAGDICNAGPVGTVNYANQHTDVIAKNILAKMAKKALVAYKAGRNLNITQLGTTHGAGCIPGPFNSQIVLGKFMVQKAKYDCFADNYWGQLGHKKAFSEGEAKEADVGRLQDILHMNEEEVTKLAEGLMVEEDVTAERT